MCASVRDPKKRKKKTRTEPNQRGASGALCTRVLTSECWVSQSSTSSYCVAGAASVGCDAIRSISRSRALSSVSLASSTVALQPVDGPRPGLQRDEGRPARSHARSCPGGRTSSRAPDRLGLGLAHHFQDRVLGVGMPARRAGVCASSCTRGFSAGPAPCSGPICACPHFFIGDSSCRSVIGHW